MIDKYDSFTKLLENEKGYNIQTYNIGSKIIIVSPHGGSIEPGTSEIAKEVAGENYSLLLFEGLLPKCNKKILHVTSTNIDYQLWTAILNQSVAGSHNSPR